MINIKKLELQLARNVPEKLLPTICIGEVGDLEAQ